MFHPSDEQENTGADSDIVTPKQCSLTHDGSDLLIHRKWGKYAGFKNLGWSLFALAMTLGMFNATGSWRAFASGFFTQDALLLAFFFGVLFALSLYFLVLGIYQIVNTTTIRVNTTSVSTEHHPLPWRTQTFLANEITQIFVTQHNRNYIMGSGPTGATSATRHNYSVNLLMSGGQKVRLVRQLPRSDQARFIEQQLERQLGIKDIPVKL
jgi:hypothetical protein